MDVYREGNGKFELLALTDKIELKGNGEVT